jgi:DNA-binding PadR family transcriptional regulator
LPWHYYADRYIIERSVSGLGQFGRYSEAALLILLSLADGPKHGYAIMQDVRQLAHVQLGPGTLYGAIARLDRLGLVEPLPAENRRRPYRLTQAGAGVLNAELSSLRRIAETGLRRLATS